MLNLTKTVCIQKTQNSQQSVGKMLYNDKKSKLDAKGKKKLLYGIFRKMTI